MNCRRPKRCRIIKWSLKFWPKQSFKLKRFNLIELWAHKSLKDQLCLHSTRASRASSRGMFTRKLKSRRSESTSHHSQWNRLSSRNPCPRKSCQSWVKRDSGVNNQAIITPASYPAICTVTQTRSVWGINITWFRRRCTSLSHLALLNQDPKESNRSSTSSRRLNLILN